MSYYQDVKKFHDRFGLITPNEFVAKIDPGLANFRYQFLIEELEEYKQCCATGDLAIAIDSLVDLVYVAYGTALFHGISEVDFDQALSLAFDGFTSHDEPVRFKPGFMSPQVNVDFTQTLYFLINVYWDEVSREDANEYKIVSALCSICNLVFNGARMMGLSEECWRDFWNDVQRANMTKIRVLKSEDSKRGSTYDVIKPPDWIPPYSEEILNYWLSK